MSLNRYLQEFLDLPVVSVPPTTEVQKEIEEEIVAPGATFNKNAEKKEVDEGMFGGGKSAEERLAKDMMKVLKNQARERNITNIRTVIQNMLSKIGG